MCILYDLRHEHHITNVCLLEQLHMVDRLSFLSSELVLSLYKWLWPAAMIVRLLLSSTLVGLWLLLHENNYIVHLLYILKVEIIINHYKAFSCSPGMHNPCNDHRGSVCPHYIPPICVVGRHVPPKGRCTFWSPVTVVPKLFKSTEHLTLSEPIHFLIIEIKYEKLLHITKNKTLA